MVRRVPVRSPTFVALPLLLLLGACTTEPALVPDAGRAPIDPVDPTPGAPEGGAQLYARLCAACHGEVGEGGLGPSLQDWSRGHADFVSITETRMPQGAPERCDAECADRIATYVIASFTAEALACDAVPPSPRRMRMLTRRELRATVRDLLGLDAGAGGDPAACRTRTFEYDPGARSVSSVSVAGSFNDWSVTAWPMTRDAGSGLWTLTRELEDGEHQYKLVVDGSEWITDPRNPDTAPDGFGGSNSVLRVSCTGTGSGTVVDPAAGLPVEPRGEGFLYDDDADAAIVTAAHVDAMLASSSAVVGATRERMSALLACAPGATREACAEAFVRRFARRAFRRPPSETEVARYLALVLAGDTSEGGAATAIRSMLVSPAFLYRSEMGEPAADGTYALTSWELASALSYQLWGTMPDDALLDAAASGSLSTPDDLEREARRMLADPRAREVAGDFALMWLGVDGLGDVTKQAAMFPAWSPALAHTMREATRRFVVEVIFDGSHGVGELLTADWGYADAELARIYGVSGPSGAALERVTRPGRAGVLGEASVLARYAHSDQSSPIRRGLFVRTNLLCQSFPPPPAEAGGVPDVDPGATTRERFAQHTEQARCASCHRFIDPVGFGFERLDAIGAWRETEAGLPIDASGDMADVDGLGTGTSAPFESLPELAATLAGSEAAPACFVRQYYRFARGFRETAEDRCAIRALVARFREHGDIRELMIDVVRSPDFARRRDVVESASEGGTP